MLVPRSTGAKLARRDRQAGAHAAARFGGPGFSPFGYYCAHALHPKWCRFRLQPTPTEPQDHFLVFTDRRTGRPEKWSA